MRVLVTRPAAQAHEWLQRLHAEGIDAAALPLIGIAAMDDAAPLREAWSRIDRQQLVMFVSPNAVEQFFALRPAHVDWPRDVLAASPGPGTTRALRSSGVPAGCVVEPASDAAQFDSEALWQRLEASDWQAAEVLFVRGESGRDWLAERFRERGARVDHVAAYRRADPMWSEDQQRVCAAALAEPRQHLWWFSSSEAIDRLADRISAPWHDAHALATHPRIAARARRLGFGEVLEVRAASDAVLAALRLARQRSIQSRPL